MKPTVSVVMPAHNAEQYIHDAIASCLHQTMADFELIVVDDGSTDETVAIVEAFGDPRIRLLRNSSNGGESVSRDRAIGAATGDWITPLDADDLMRPNRLETMWRIAEELGEDAVLFGGLCPFVTDRTGRVRVLKRGGLRRMLRSFRETAQIVEVDPVVFVANGGGKAFFSAALLRRTGAHHPPGAKVGADTAFYIQLLNHPNVRVFSVHPPTYLYRIRPDSAISSSNRISEEEHAYSYVLEESHLRPELEAALVSRLKTLEKQAGFQAVRSALRSGRTSEALRIILTDRRIGMMALQALPRFLLYRLQLRVWGGRGR